MIISSSLIKHKLPISLCLSPLKHHTVSRLHQGVVIHRNFFSRFSSFFFFFFLFSFISYSLVLHFTTPFIEVLLFGSPSGIAFPQVYRRAYDSPTASTCEPNNCKNLEDFEIQDFKLVLPTALSKFESRTYIKIHILKPFFFFFSFCFQRLLFCSFCNPSNNGAFFGRNPPKRRLPDRSRKCNSL